MPSSISRKELLRKFKALGYSGPFSGGRHQFMVKGKKKIRIPNPHFVFLFACWLNSCRLIRLFTCKKMKNRTTVPFAFSLHLTKKEEAQKIQRYLLLGLTYKSDVDDVRESPSLELIELLRNKGAKVDYNDPYVPKTHKMRRYDFKMASVPLTEKNLKKYDCILISTDHSSYNYNF
ncbi:MAG: hypothetical protein COS27_10600 [Nitrospirae bacterium CG02_land_8_20_14_3_00_41_53]|nr:MAG: hypothetical protein COV68_05475 [Nitrospirae bacterium CG11_big_fil_rev_8_21_14_0_20_41_14]PIV41151.1 MAG: hypothetical protein COS27_10600 [Nitrospirae bacterium CG02_land_8_20_14_3_00_41_53]PIW88083.1 MAG: hypothetical protein COZ94_01650 [Nitrospirae bacterium CG_4_8_14_3_um_filter_41_47]